MIILSLLLFSVFFILNLPQEESQLRPNRQQALDAETEFSDPAKQAAMLALRKPGVMFYAHGSAEAEMMDWGALAGAPFSNTGCHTTIMSRQTSS